MTLQLHGSHLSLWRAEIGHGLAVVLALLGALPLAAQPNTPGATAPNPESELPPRQPGLEDPAQGHSAAAGASSQPTPFLLIRSDRQTVDAERRVVVAEGNVEARFQGWRLLADRVEVIEPSRTVYATGRLRLYKGDQMLQASRLRYSQLEGTGELEDIYGVVDQEGGPGTPSPATANRRPDEQP